jgi:hypothetical protein
MGTFHIASPVGRLIEVRVDALADLTTVAELGRLLDEALRRIGTNAVVVADWRGAEVLSPEIGDAVFAVLQQGNARFDRSAHLLAKDRATLSLQLERLIREARNPKRRTFRDSAALLAWIAGGLGQRELARATEFITR